MTLAAYSDANKWLDKTKIAFENATDAAEDAASADSVVKAALTDLYPTKINLWIETVPTPNPQSLESTPDLVRSIAAMLMAAYRYQKRYSEESQDPNSFASRLEARAMEFLQSLREGSMSLADAPTLQSALGFLESDYWPNDKTVVEEDRPQVGLAVGDPLRFFDMDNVF